jgi:hypothetical protein
MFDDLGWWVVTLVVVLILLILSVVGCVTVLGWATGYLVGKV